MARSTAAYAGSGVRSGGWLADRPIAVKIGVLTAVLGLVGVALGVVALLNLRAAASAAAQLNERNVAGLAAAARLRGDFRTYRIRVLTAGLAAPGPDQVAEWEDAEAAWAEVQAAVDAARPLAAGDPQRAALVAQVADAYTAYHEFVMTTMRPLAEKADTAAFDDAADVRGEEIATPAIEAIDALYALERQEASANAQAAADAGTAAMIQILVIMVVGMTAAIIVGWRVTRSITAPVAKVGLVLDGLAQRDLTGRTGVAQADEIGRMASSLDSSLGILGQTLGQVVGSANTLSSAATQLSASTRSLTGTAGVVSGNVQTVAAGAEQMGASISEIASSAARAVAIADDAVAAAARANQMVSQLSRSSNEIGSVISTIADLADETNTLALNATIEAARAGDSGRGFAVVAGEVKSLAHQTTEATSDIERRIRAIQADADAAVSSIGEITGVIEAIATHQSTIAAAVEEQTAVTAEMARSVHDAAEGVNGIAGSADRGHVRTGGLAELEAVTEELSVMSADLTDLIGRFRY